MRKNKTLVMIGGGVQQVRAVQIVQAAGYHILVTDRTEQAPCFRYADHVAQIDGRNVEDIIAFILINKDRLNIVGIFTLTELVTSVAVVANACGLPGVSIKSAVTCQNKALCKEVWLKNKVSTPQGRVASSISEARVVFEQLRGRVFVKPIVGFGGKGAQKIQNLAHLEEYFKEGQGEEILIEELVEGTMHDVNGIIDEDDKFWPMGIVDRFFLEDFPVEKEIQTPSKLEKDDQEKLYQLLEQSVRSLGIHWGPVKGDAVLYENKFSMLEVAPRLHGPKNSLYLLPYSGLDCLNKSLGILSGESNNDFSFVQNKYSICSAVLPEPGTLFERKIVSDSLNSPGIVEALIFAEDGEEIRNYKNSTNVPAYIFSKGKTLSECKNYLFNTNLIQESE